MPNTPRSSELLESLLEGATLQPQELDDLVNTHRREDQYLEYKNSKELDDQKKAAATVRQYVSGFANSMGGVLMFGVDENTWTISRCTAPGGGELDEWAARCLTPIHAYLSPPPRFLVVPHAAGSILVIVTARTPGLVPIVEVGQAVYYFRLHDQTIKAPDYLVSDLVLGRRQHPDLHITNFQLVSAVKAVPSSTTDIEFIPKFHIENQSLLWTEHVQVGAVSWAIASSSYDPTFSNHLRSHIEIQEVTSSLYSDPVKLIHAVGTTIGLMNPFEIEDSKYGTEYTIPVRYKWDHWLNYKWKAAFYVFPYHSLPIWYQVSLKVNVDLLTYLRDHTEITPDGDFLTLERVLYERPVVAWEKSE